MEKKYNFTANYRLAIKQPKTIIKVKGSTLPETLIGLIGFLLFK